MTHRDELNARIAADYRRVTRAMDRVVLPVMVERDVTMAQFKALMALSPKKEAGMTVTGLGCELSIGQPSASLLADQLAKKGYASRRADEQDRRRTLVCITAAGEELVAELRQGRRSTFFEWLSRLDDEQAEALAGGLRALADAAE